MHGWSLISSIINQDARADRYPPFNGLFGGRISDSLRNHDVSTFSVVPVPLVLGEGRLDALQRILASGFSRFRRAGLFIGLACLFTSIAIGYLLGALLAI